MSSLFDEDKIFEEEVLRIARQLWPQAEYGGAEIVQGKERDGIFVGEDIVNLVECTTSRKKEKAEKDIGKLEELFDVQRKKYVQKAVKGWFITREEPTADQRAVAQGSHGKVVALSFEQFRSKLIDAKGYLDLRRKYPFGSARDLETNSFEDRAEYVPLDFVSRSRGGLASVDELAKGLQQGRRFVLLGDYGAGKSTSMRELFHRLSRAFYAQASRAFPVMLNLRDHQGQTNPAEALIRHGTNLGFPNPLHLVRAWRAGYVVLLLDGFDEVASAGWIGRTRKLREVRHQSVRLIRELLRDTPSGIGVAISGREFFFDSPKEMNSALGLDESYEILSLTEFTDEQIRAFLAKKGLGGMVPAWLPSRPLLLGYLAARGLLKRALEMDAGASPAEGWDSLLNHVCEREAEIEAGIVGETVRTILERLATVARRDQNGLGPLGFEDIFRAFQDVCGYPPDESASVLLQRLPGLGVRSAEDGSRAFIDASFADAARAGDLCRFVEDPHGAASLGIGDPSSWQCLLSELGVQVAAHKLKRAKVLGGKLGVAVQFAAQRLGWEGLTVDVLNVAHEMEAEPLKSKVYISEFWIPHFTLYDSETSWTNVEFQDCIVGRLEAYGELEASVAPKFLRCHFGVVEGKKRIEELPQVIFENCEVDGFEVVQETTSSLLELPLPMGTRVLLTILKKLYMQRGSGRKESAFFRGLDHRGKRLVPDLLGLLQRERLALRTRAGEQTVWLPERSNMARVRQILASPTTSKDPLLALSEQIS